jgi:glutaredoxin
MRHLTLFTRAGCCLCDQAREVLERVRQRYPFALEERDIESDDALFRAYLERIPVVAIDGQEIFELLVDERELERRLGIVNRDELHRRP